MPEPHHIVVGQTVSPTKKHLARQLRREQTPAEHMLWQALRANRVRGLQFRRQQVIDGFIVDFYCHAAGLAVEADGPVHEQQDEYDRERDQALAARGLRVLHVTNDEVIADLAGVIQRIEAVAGTPLPAPMGEGRSTVPGTR